MGGCGGTGGTLEGSSPVYDMIALVEVFLLLAMYVGKSVCMNVYLCVCVQRNALLDVK